MRPLLEVEFVPIPEPSSVALATLGLLSLAVCAKCRRR
ncbi:MAG: PEP-CTERM sorting domain-containing protein [Aeoliella sp.]